MKKIRLSDPLSRFICVVGDIILAGAVTALLLLHGRSGSLVFFAVLGIVLLLLLIPYTIFVFSAALIVGHDRRSVTLTFPLRRETIAVSSAANVSTRETQLENKKTRTIVFSGADGKEICSIPTFIVAGQGAKNELLAAELASALGIAFVPTVDPALYDKKARREKEAAEREAAKKRRDEKRARRKTSRIEEEKTAAPLNSAAEKINYDELDDLK